MGSENDGGLVGLVFLSGGDGGGFGFGRREKGKDLSER